jgi:DNA-binding Lrp family transcriptional regulator
MLYIPTVISIVEVLLVIVPALLSVAYVTVAERKTMASMQRRLGPNAVGQKNWKFSFIRLYHSSSYDKAIEEALYKNRKAPVKPLNEKVVSVCKDLLSSTTVSTFFKDLKGKGGIYLFTLKNNPNIFYIGRAKDFQKRFKSHLNIKLSDRFHTFANSIGWDKFEFSVVEICNIDVQQERENYFLQNYLPLLNTIFKSNLNDTQTYDSLYEILKLRQLQSNFENKYQGINIYLYEYVNGQLSTICNTFSSINQLSNHLGVARETLSVYLNTYVPYRNSLFLTNEIESFELVEKLISDATQGLELDRNIAKKVWMYFIEADGTIVKTSYESKGAVAKFLNVQYRTITNHLDKWIKGGIKGNYTFSYELESLELEKLMEVSSLRRFNNCRVWVYNASTLELLLDSFTSMQKAADFFNVDYRSILNNLDTGLATIKDGKLVLLFSHELTKSEKESLLNNVQKAMNETVSVWVYKKVNDKLILLNNNKPTYSSKLEASKELKMSTKTISKYLDTHKEYKGLFFYSVSL